jgi:hypothetical protein
MKLSPRLWLLTLILAGLTLSGCTTLMNQLKAMANLSKCEFRLVSVDQVTLVGIPLQGKLKPSDIGPMGLLKLHSALSSGNLPLRFTLNVEAKNPNDSPAGMSRMEWILFMDGTRLTAGVLEKQVEIAPNGGFGNFPMVMDLDLNQILSGKALDSMINLGLNIAGEGSKPTRVTLQVKPSILVAGQRVDYPDYVTVTHEFGRN